MIGEAKYKEILDSGLILDHYFLLCQIKTGQKLVASRRILGFTNLLTKKGYLDDGKLTQKALDFIQIYEAPSIIKKGILSRNHLPIGDWVAEVHKKCQDKLVELTGKKQIVGRVTAKGKGFPFLCNSIDLGKALASCISAYKLTDYKKIENTLLLYIERCNRQKDWFPILQYYIIKNGNSPMVTEMEGNDESMDDQDFKSSQKFV